MAARRSGGLSTQRRSEPFVPDNMSPIKLLRLPAALPAEFAAQDNGRGVRNRTVDFCHKRSRQIPTQLTKIVSFRQKIVRNC